MRRLVSLAFVIAVSCAQGSVMVDARRPIAPSATPWASVSVSTPQPTAIPQTPAPVAAPAPLPRPPAGDGVATFRGLGAWVDVYDYGNDPSGLVSLVREIAAHGVRVLYLETGRVKTTADISYPAALGAALDAAKSLGLRVVAWYPPDFGDVARDLERSLAAINFRSPAGNHVDAFGADIESTAGVSDPAERNRRAADYSAELRRRAGGVPLAAIVYPPTQIARRPSIWPGYPWRTFGAYYDIVMGMHYFTFRTNDPRQVEATTEANAKLIRSLTGKPAHVIGGLAGDANPSEIAAYVVGALESGSIGGSLYDARTTSAAEWLALAALNR